MQDLMPPVNTPDKLFHDGDPTQGIEGTIVTAEWLNNDQSAVRDVQAELINVLAAAALTPDPTKQDQLVKAIQAIVGSGTADKANSADKLSTARKIANHPFDGTADISISASDVGALPSDGKASSASSADQATKLSTPRNIAGHPFDGTADISIGAGDVGAVPTSGGSVDYLDGASYYKTNPAAWPGVGAFAEQYSNPVAPFTIPYGRAIPKDVSQYLPIIKGLSATEQYGFGAAVSFGILRSGNNDFGSAVVHIIGDNGAGAVYQFSADGIFNSPSQLYSGGIIGAAGDIRSNGGSLYAAGQVSVGGNVVAGSGVFESGGYVRVYSPNNPPPAPAAQSTGGLGQNGWHKDLNTGLITQWGYIPNGTQSTTFPIAFPSALFSIVISSTDGGRDGATNIGPADNNGFTVGNGNTGSFYIAKGY